MKTSPLFIHQFIKITRNLIVVILSTDGKNYIDYNSIYYVTEKSLPQTNKLKSYYDKVIRNKHFRNYINDKIGNDEDKLIKNSELNGFLTDHYAIINIKYLASLMIFSRIDTLKLEKEKLNIAIDGNSTAGKTTFSSMLKEVHECNVFHIDDFFKKPNGNLKSSYANNIDFNRLKKEVLEPIQLQKDILYKELDITTHQLKDPVKISYRAINIIEGAFSMHPEIIDYYDLKIFMKAKYCNQIIRIYQRNGIKKLFEFIKKWIPNENRYIKDLDIKNHADIIIQLKHF